MKQEMLFNKFHVVMLIADTQQGSPCVIEIRIHEGITSNHADTLRGVAGWKCSMQRVASLHYYCASYSKSSCFKNTTVACSYCCLASDHRARVAQRHYAYYL